MIFILVPAVFIVLISVIMLWNDEPNLKPINGNQPPQVEEQPVEGKPIENLPIPPIVKEVTVKLVVVKDRCWIQVNIDEIETPVFRGTLYAGEEMEFKGEKEVRLWIGNAGAIKLIVNGVEQPAIGKDGEVIRDLVFYPPD